MNFLIDLLTFGAVAVVMVALWWLICTIFDRYDASRNRRDPIKSQMFDASRDAFFHDLLADDRKRAVMNQMREYPRQSR